MQRGLCPPSDRALANNCGAIIRILVVILARVAPTAHSSVSNDAAAVSLAPALWAPVAGAFVAYDVCPVTSPLVALLSEGTHRGKAKITHEEQSSGIHGLLTQAQRSCRSAPAALPPRASSTTYTSATVVVISPRGQTTIEEQLVSYSRHSTSPGNGSGISVHMTVKTSSSHALSRASQEFA